MQEIFYVYDPHDEAGQRNLTLEAAGFSMFAMKSGRDCIERLASHKPDLVLLDVLIEGENGFVVCRRVRELYKPSELPVILCSTIYRSRIYRDEAALAGAQRYLLSPVPAEDLVREVGDVLKGRLLPARRG
jgi:CheY-like chemotaxis protein